MTRMDLIQEIDEMWPWTTQDFRNKYAVKLVCLVTGYPYATLSYLQTLHKNIRRNALKNINQNKKEKK